MQLLSSKELLFVELNVDEVDTILPLTLVLHIIFRRYNPGHTYAARLRSLRNGIWQKMTGSTLLLSWKVKSVNHMLVNFLQIGGVPPC